MFFESQYSILSELYFLLVPFSDPRLASISLRLSHWSFDWRIFAIFGTSPELLKDVHFIFSIQHFLFGCQLLQFHFDFACWVDGTSFVSHPDAIPWLLRFLLCVHLPTLFRVWTICHQFVAFDSRPSIWAAFGYSPIVSLWFEVCALIDNWSLRAAVFLSVISEAPQGLILLHQDADHNGSFDWWGIRFRSRWWK